MRRLNELAQAVGGQVSHSPQLEISDAGRITSVSTSGVTFVTSAKHLQSFWDSCAAAAVIPKDLDGVEEVISTPDHKPLILVDNAEVAFEKIAALFRPPVQRRPSGIHPAAILGHDVTIGQGATVHAGAVIMDGCTIGDRSTIFPNATVMEACKVGADTQIFPGVVLYEHTVVGDRVILHAGVVLGAYGFGYKSNTGKHILSAQLGNVVIEDDVELGANTTVDRGTFDSTYIRRGTKIDNLVMVGHNCDIGEDTLLCSQVGIAGSCDVGNGVIMGGQVGVGDHITVGDGSMVMAKSGLMYDVEPGAAMNGIPARPARRHMQIHAVSLKLPEMRRTLKSVEKQLQAIQAKAQDDASTNTDQTKRAA